MLLKSVLVYLKAFINKNVLAWVGFQAESDSKASNTSAKKLKVFHELMILIMNLWNLKIGCVLIRNKGWRANPNGRTPSGLFGLLTA